MSAAPVFTDAEPTIASLLADIDAIRVQVLTMNFRTAAGKASALSTACHNAGLTEAGHLAHQAFADHVRPALFRGDGPGIKLPNWGDYLTSLSNIERAIAEAA